LNEGEDLAEVLRHLFDVHSGGAGQYIPTGRTSTAPPMRAAGIRAANPIAASLSSASKT
jgi:hypothetical protein